jgi:hypothetical protein
MNRKKNRQRISANLTRLDLNLIGLVNFFASFLQLHLEK